jgi:DNA mismatch repair ATPase MutL
MATTEQSESSGSETQSESSDSAATGTTKKAPSKKAAAKKAPTKKAPTKKAAAKRPPSKKAAPSAERSERATERAAEESSEEREQSGRTERPRKKAKAMDIARSAARQLAELTGRVPECVIGIERTDDGWRVDLEVVESRRIPDSTDILATYQVDVDEDGDLTGYHRAQRYVRGKGSDREGGR